MFATLIAAWGNQIAADIEPVEIQKWFNRLHNKDEYAWTTVSKIRGIMSQIYEVGIIHQSTECPRLRESMRRTTNTKARP